MVTMGSHPDQVDPPEVRTVSGTAPRVAVPWSRSFVDRG